MNGFVSSIAILVAASIILDAARVPSTMHKSAVDGGKFVLPSEWLKISIKNESVINVPVGTALEIDCEAVGSPPPTIRWYHRQTLLSESGFPEQNEIVNVAIGKLKSRIFINCVMPHHQGVYTCSGSAGSKKRTPPSVTVIVGENDELPNPVCDKNKPMAPRIVTWAPTLLEFADRDVVLPCVAIGNPTPVTYWVNHENEVVASDTVSSQFKLLDGGELLIPRLVWDDMGTYTCVAENGYGSDSVETFVYPVKKSDS